MKRRNLDPAKRHLERLKTKHQKCRKENAWLKADLRKKEKTYDEAKWLRFDAEQEAKRLRQQYASEPQQHGCLGCASTESLTRRLATSDEQAKSLMRRLATSDELAKRSVAESQKQSAALLDLYKISEQSIRDQYLSKPQQDGCLGCASIHSRTRHQLSPCVDGPPVDVMEFANEVHPIQIDDLSIEICTTCKGTPLPSRSGHRPPSHPPTWQKITGSHPGIQGLLQKILKKD